MIFKGMVKKLPNICADNDTKNLKQPEMFYRIDDVTRRLEGNKNITQTTCKIELNNLTLHTMSFKGRDIVNYVDEKLYVLVMLKINKSKRMKDGIIINCNLGNSSMNINQEVLVRHYLKSEVIPLLFKTEVSEAKYNC